jgi:hypothetical protein
VFNSSFERYRGSSYEHALADWARIQRWRLAGSRSKLCRVCRLVCRFRQSLRYSPWNTQ